MLGVRGIGQNWRIMAAFNLSFTLVPCQRCRSKERVAGTECSDCGDPGRANEVNAQVAKRRQGVRAVREMVVELSATESEVLPYYRSHDSWRPSMVGALEQTMVAFTAFASQPVSTESQRAAASAIARLEQIERDLASLPPRRPFILDLQADKTAAACFVRMAKSYLDAFQAATPLEAQSSAQRAQDEIDAATEVHRQAEYERDLGNRLNAGDPTSLVKAAIQVLAEMHPGKAMFELDAEMRPLLSNQLGRHVAVGQGAGYVLAETVAKSTLDVDRFRTVTLETSQLINWDAHLREVANEPGALAALRRAREAILESTVAFTASLSTATTDEAMLRRTLNLYRELFEDAGLPLFAWILRLSGVRSAPIATLMSEDSTTLLGAVNKRPELERIFVGADKNIRTAASHGFGYRLDGHDVVFNLRSFSGKMTVDVVIDLLLALQESFLAVFWVLDNELAEIDLEEHLPWDLWLGAPMLLMAEESLKGMGATVVVAEESGNKWRFVLAPGARSAPYLYAGALATTPPNGIGEVSIECPELQEGQLSIPRDAIVRFINLKDAPPIELVSANLALLSESTLDGRTAVTTDHLRSIVGFAGLTLLDQNTSGIQLLRQCILLARSLEADDVIGFAESTFSEWRNPDPSRRRKLLQVMLEWSSLPAPIPPAVRLTRVVSVASSEIVSA